MLEFDPLSIRRCIECRGCEQDCPAFKVVKGYDPTRVNRDILMGKAEEWVASDMIWQCLECHTCTELCPQNYSWEKVMTQFKAEAMRRGLGPKMVRKGIETFIRTGRMGEPRISVRKGLGLPEPAQDGLRDFQRLVDALGVKGRLQGLTENKPRS